MCGILGGWGYDDRPAIERMASSLSHRGPDDYGFYFDSHIPVALAHRRLSIIDLTPGGHQPMLDASGRFVIVYNGEIYNFQEIRHELKSLGHRFRSSSDTEVILNAFKEWGQGCLGYFRGMFAFVILDRGQQFGHCRLDGLDVPREPFIFMARDRLGIKPLLYSNSDGKLIFASELKAILASGLVNRIIYGKAIEDFFLFGSVLQPKTILKNVRHLQAGHFAFFTPRQGFKETRYYDLLPATEEKRALFKDLSYEEAIQRVRVDLEKAVEYHLVSDVPVGAFLSGGVDSTTVVALMAKHIPPQTIKTFSVGFREKTEVLDETSFASQTAEFLGTDHREIIIDADQVPGIMEDFLTAIDQPSIDGLNTFIVSRSVEHEVKVVVSGTGGDEFFAGYPHFDHIYRSRAVKWYGLERCLPLLQSIRPNRYTYPLRFAGSSIRQSILKQRIQSTPDQLKSLLKKEAIGEKMINPSQEYFSGGSAVGLPVVAEISYWEATRYLKNTILRDSDAVSMACSLELRPVLMDHVLAETVFALPDSIKLQGGRLKPVLIDAVRDIIPENCWKRPKSGFEMPRQFWMNGPLHSKMEGIFRSPLAKAFCQPATLDGIYTQLSAGTTDNAVWPLFIFLAWCEKNAFQIEYA